MITLTLTLADGRTATIGDGAWQSESPELAAMLNLQNTLQGEASYLPHPFLHVAEWAQGEFGGAIEADGDDDSEDGDVC